MADFIQEYEEKYNKYYSSLKGNEKEFDIRGMFMLLLRYKYWFIASVVVCLSLAFVYLHYATPVYQIYSKVLIKEQDKRAYSISSINSTFRELGFMNNSAGFDNELEILSTMSLAKRTVRSLRLYTSYYSVGKMNNVEIYQKNVPCLIDLTDVSVDSLQGTVTVTIKSDDDCYLIGIKYRQEKVECSVRTLPAHINTSFGTVLIERNPIVDKYIVQGGEQVKECCEGIYSTDMIVYINPIDKVAAHYSNALFVAPTSNTTSIAKLSITDNLPERGVDYLNRLVEIYNEDANEDNTLEAKRTEEFISERLGIITKELNMTETDLEQFKQSSGLVDFVSDTQLSMAQNVKYETQILDVSTQLSLVGYILEYINNEVNWLQVIPVNIGLQDYAVNTMIAKYNELVLERNKLLHSANEDNPTVSLLTGEAKDYLRGIKSSLLSAKEQLTIQRNQLQGQLDKYTNRIISAPSKERVLADINRQQEVKAGLYLMLLQKREENAIALASMAYKGKVIESPIVTAPVSPKRNMIMLIALVLGIVLPYAYYYIRNFFRYRIEKAEDLLQITNIPLIGNIPFVKVLAKGDRSLVVQENHNSMIVEVYRSIRSNLPFVLSNGQNAIMFTSTMAGEGKTCIASNLAASLAFADKRVVLIDLDFRKPRMASLFGLSEKTKGFSNFFTRQSDDYDFLESLISNSVISRNLDIIPAGPIPPNPSELLEKENLITAIEYLKKKYDYVLLDTAPVGVVSDTLTIGKVVDVTMFVVRANFTLKSDLDFVNRLVAEHRLPNLNLIINAVKKTSEIYGYKRYVSVYGDGKKIEEV